jgi:hypothetical protein
LITYSTPSSASDKTDLQPLSSNFLLIRFPHPCRQYAFRRPPELARSFRVLEELELGSGTYSVWTFLRRYPTFGLGLRGVSRLTHPLGKMKT